MLANFFNDVDNLDQCDENIRHCCFKGREVVSDGLRSKDFRCFFEIHWAAFLGGIVDDVQKCFLPLTGLLVQ